METARWRTTAVLGVSVVVLATVVGCGGSGTGMTTSAPAATSATSFVGGAAILTIPNIATGTSARARHAQFVSPSAVSVGIAINGGTALYANVASGSPLCTAGPTSRTCSIPLSAPVGNDTFAASLYDAPNGSGTLLGSGSGMQTVVFGTPFNVIVSLSPVPATGTGVVTYASGTSFILGTAGTATVTFTVSDPDGNVIPTSSPVPYSPALSLTSSDPNITVSPTSWSGPPQAITLAYNGAASVASTVTISLSAGSTAVAKAIANVSGSTQVSCLVAGGPTASSNPLPGTYTGVTESGIFTPAGGYIPTGGTWTAATYTPAPTTPPSTPTPTPTGPTPTPLPSPSPGPTSTPVYNWYGTYTIGAFTATTAQGGTLPVGATSGCFGVIATQGNAFGYGDPAFATAAGSSSAASGMLTSFTVTPPLTTTSGPFTVNFTLSTGASGTATLTQFTSTTTSSVARRGGSL